MESELKSVHEHMLMLGLGALAHANWHANYHSFENRFWPELSVIQAAHAAEILLKARIVQEHPLLIFEQMPKPESPDGAPLTLASLVESGRTYQYADLPGRLWATIGVHVPNLKKFQSFGRLRNSIQHFTSPNRDVSAETVEFIYDVIDPFINQCWGLYAVDYNEDYDHPKYLVEGLIRREIMFLVSPQVAEEVHEGRIDFEWPADNPKYQAEMISRIDLAVAAYQEEAATESSDKKS